jgi:hypothetical protein
MLLDPPSHVALGVFDLADCGVKSFPDRNQDMLALVAVRPVNDDVLVTGMAMNSSTWNGSPLRCRVCGPLTTTRQLVMLGLNSSRRRTCAAISARISSDGSQCRKAISTGVCIMVLRSRECG